MVLDFKWKIGLMSFSSWRFPNLLNQLEKCLPNRYVFVLEICAFSYFPFCSLCLLYVFFGHYCYVFLEGLLLLRQLTFIMQILLHFHHGCFWICHSLCFFTQIRFMLPLLVLCLKVFPSQFFLEHLSVLSIFSLPVLYSISASSFFI